jgi:hypothetical protein
VKLTTHLHIFFFFSSSSTPQPSLGLGLLRNFLPLKMAEFLAGFSTISFFTGEGC